MDRGLAYASQHELRLASEDFSQAIQLNPKDAKAYMNRGLTRILQNLEVEARQDFDTCLKYDPTLKKELDRRLAAARAQVAKQIADERAKPPVEPPKSTAPHPTDPDKSPETAPE